MSNLVIPARLKLSIVKSSWPKCLIYLIIVLSLFERLLVQFGLPGSIIYFIDFLNIFLFLYMFNRYKWIKFIPFIMAYLGIISIGIVIGIINYNVWKGSLLFTIIEIRNLVRFPIFFISVITFFDKTDVEKVFSLLTKLFYLNFILILHQYFTFHPDGIWTRGDYINGFFGLSVGGNTFVNSFMLCVVIFWLCKWSNKQCKIWNFLLPFGISIVIAALIELKAFFAEIGIIYIYYLLYQRKTARNFINNAITIFLLCLISFISLQVMFHEYPWFRESMSFSGMIELASNTSGYTGAGDLNRLTAIPTISQYIFKGDVLEILSGIGLGNGATYSLGGATTEFYQAYKSMNYSWFSSSYIFIQCGLIGLLLYIFSFIYLFFKHRNTSYKLLSKTIVLISLFLIIYNETLKTDAGYFIYFAIATGFIQNNVYVNYQYIRTQKQVTSI